MTCSTGRDSANEVNPRRSMNITVAHRRTAPIEGRPPVAVRSSAAIGSGRKRVKTSFTRCCSRSWRRRRLSPDPIRARRIAGSNGLGRKSSAPASMHRTMAAVSSTPEIMITGTWRSPSWSLRRSSTSMPSRPGISTSRSTRSGGSVSSAASASKPFSNWTVPCPSFSRCLASNRRFNGSSSTIAIVAGGVSVPAKRLLGRRTGETPACVRTRGFSHAAQAPNDRDSPDLRGGDLLVGVDERERCGGADAGAVVGLDVEAGAGLGQLDRHPDVADVLLQAR